MKPIKITVRPSGIRFLYDDRLALSVLGPVVVTRASNVEWDAALGGWTVQFADGMYLLEDRDPVTAAFAIPKVFDKRADALAAEVAAIHAAL